MGMKLIQLVYYLCAISFVLALQGSTGLTTFPTPATSSDIAPMQGSLGPVQNGNSFSNNARSPVSQPIGSSSPSELASPPVFSPPEPQTQEGLIPSSLPIITEVFPPFNTAPPPVTDQGHEPAIPPADPRGKEPIAESPVSLPVAPAPPPITVHVPVVPPIASRGKEPVNESPVSLPVALAPPPIMVHVPTIPPTASQGKEPVTELPVSLPVAPAPPPITIHVPAVQPTTSQGKEPVIESPVSLPVAPAPPPITVHVPAIPPTASQGKEPVTESPVSLPIAPTPPPITIHVPAVPPTASQGKEPVTESPVSLPIALAPPPITVHVPAVPPTASQGKGLVIESPASLPVAPAPPLITAHVPVVPPTASQGKEPVTESPVSLPVARAPPAIMVHVPVIPPTASRRMEPIAESPVSPPVALAPPTITVHVPAVPPIASQGKEPINESPVSLPVAPAPPPIAVHVPVIPPTTSEGKEPVTESPVSLPVALAPPAIMVHVPIVPPSASQGKEPVTESPVSLPVAPAPPPITVHVTAVPPAASQGKEPVTESPVSLPVAPGPPPITVHVPSVPRIASQGKEPVIESPVSLPIAPASPPVTVHGHAVPSTASQGKEPVTESPVLLPVALAPPPITVHVPAVPPIASQGKEPVTESPVLLPVAPAPPPVMVYVPAVQPTASQGKETVTESPVAPVPVETPSRIMPQVSPTIHPSTPEIPPISRDQRNSTNIEGPISEPITPVSVASPPRTSGLNPPVTVVSPPSQAPQSLPFIRPTAPRGSPLIPDREISPVSSPPPIIDRKREGIPVVAPSYTKPQPSPPVGQIRANGSAAGAPSEHEPPQHFYAAPPPLLLPDSHNKGNSPSASSPATSFYKHHHARNKITNPASAPSSPIHPPPLKQQGPAVPPAPLQTHRERHYASPPSKQDSPVSPSRSPFYRPLRHVSPAPTSSQQAVPSNPKKSPKVSHPPPLRAFPPPPPNEDCSATICTEPYTNSPPGTSCACVLPIQVGLRLSVALYTFFPLVSELAQEIAAGVFIKQSQVRIVGANAANQQPDKTVVLVDLVPLGARFDNTTAFLTYQRFWNKQVTIQASYFGDYEVLYVRYPGLPPSPPSAGGIIDGGPYPGIDSNARTIKPFGADVPKKHHKKGLSSGIIAIIVLSSFLAVILCSAVAWFFLFKRRDKVSQQGPTPKVLQSIISKPSGPPGSHIGSRHSFASLSFGSSIATYTGSAKTFSASDIERATDYFNASKVLGEGGFGRVYSGVLEDGTKVAVKVLKRDDQQGGREFLAEVEMLSRLHHRNLVKLIGICIEERTRCLVYELIPNGSVESHLHGVDKETAPLNWGARMKIALGAARGLAYLHEDSSPRVIHRDFKSSNILLEDDFTPKVSDFGLARAALDEENRHISTRVMGTFGYVAPEYAMTGHLLVKSDVYSYGVVLLELLTGRKPVDMSQPPGQENLVSWARLRLTSKEGLEIIIDPSLGPDVPFDNVAKVAAIASMCVQPEVSNRPFMGEVVQALKLVCNEIEEAKELGSRTSSREHLSIDLDASEQLQSQYSVHSYESELDFGRGMSASELIGTSARLGTEQSESFRRHSSSGPLGSRRSKHFWQRVRGLSGGSVSEHGFTFKLWPGSH